MSDALTRATAAHTAFIRGELDSLRQFGFPLEPPDPLTVVHARAVAMLEIYTATQWGESLPEAKQAFAESAGKLLEAVL